MTLSPVVERNSPLSDFDRCDRCGSRAYVRVAFTIGELLFCGHHGREYSGGLSQNDACTFYDDTAALLASEA